MYSRRVMNRVTRGSVRTAPLGAGERVVIQEGPFRGIEGTVVEERSPRIVLSVRLMFSLTSVELDRDWVRPRVPPQSARTL